MKLKVIVYSDKAIAVVGDTKSVKDQLKSIGGKFNPRLSCGAGWIFSKRKLDQVNALLDQVISDDQECSATAAMINAHEELAFEGKNPDTLMDRMFANF
jgi:hypothetical protein